MATLPSLTAPFGINYGPVTPYPPTLIAAASLTVNANAFPTLFFGAFNSLFLYINVTGYAGTDVVSLRFNGDNGTNYWDRTLTAGQGGVVLTNTETPSTTLIRCGLPINKGRAVTAQIVNQATRSKVVMINNQFGSGTAATPAVLTLGTAGEWINTTAQITQLDVLTAGGVNLTAGSSVMVYGGL